tara:strand:+ start:17422 stop:18252 length:831 start_codon:yes stop_codon:yes gene_type:complete
MVKQDKLIGKHPPPPNIFGKWLNSENHPENDRQCHRSLSQIDPSIEDELIEWLSEKIIAYHYKEEQIERLKRKYRQLGFTEYAENLRMIPNDDKTRKGNMAEVVLCEYILSSTTKPLIKTFRFRYSTNIDQSMKGDDMLMIDYDGEKEDIEIYLGEAKFRQTPSALAVRKIAASLAKDTKPLSFTFLVERLLESESTKDIGNRLGEYVIESIKQQRKITYSGLLLSNISCANTVQKNLDSDNPKLVFLSLGIDNPTVFMEKVFERVEEKLANPEEI